MNFRSLSLPSLLSCCLEAKLGIFGASPQFLGSEEAVSRDPDKFESLVRLFLYSGQNSQNIQNASSKPDKIAKLNPDKFSEILKFLEWPLRV